MPGFIANRLQEALWREALHMVEAGEATVEQIDLSITDGPGLRWPIQGPMLTFHLAGGQGGMAHMLDHFGPSLLSPWTRLVAPELTPELRDAVVDGCDREADGRSIDDLVAERDRGVIAILRALGRGRDPEPVVWREPVQDAWIDYNGHLSEPYYVLVFGHATDAVMDAGRAGPGVPRGERRLALHGRGARPLPRRGLRRQRPRGALVGHRRHRQAAVDLARALGRRPAARHRGGPRRARGRAAARRRSPTTSRPAPGPRASSRPRRPAAGSGRSPCMTTRNVSTERAASATRDQQLGVARPVPEPTTRATAPRSSARRSPTKSAEPVAEQVRRRERERQVVRDDLVDVPHQVGAGPARAGSAASRTTSPPCVSSYRSPT